MSHRQQVASILGSLLLAVGSVTAQSVTMSGVQSAVRPGYDIKFIGPPMADPLLQHRKETYVLYGCAYCHGLYLETRSEAADLLHSRLVGRDEDGTVIGNLLRAGIPQTAKLSPMPQFSDLSETQLKDIAGWVHYARQQGRYKELTGTQSSAPGNAADGKGYFDKNCISCHANVNELASTARKLDAVGLKAAILRPKFVTAPQSMKVEELNDTKTATARQRHLWILENYSTEDVANLTAYLASLK